MTESQSTLRPKSQPFDDIQTDEFIRRLMHLNAEQKARVLQMLGGSTWPEDGAGVVDVAARNRAFNKEELNWPEVSEVLAEQAWREQLDQQLDEIGIDADARHRMAKLFFEMATARGDKFKNQLGQLLEDYGAPTPWISDPEIDACEILAARIDELTDALDVVEQENAALAGEILDDGVPSIVAYHSAMSVLPEESRSHFIRDWSAPVHEGRSPRRSTINECMMEADEANADALYNESPIGNSDMRRYLRAAETFKRED